MPTVQQRVQPEGAARAALITICKSCTFRCCCGRLMPSSSCSVQAQDHWSQASWRGLASRIWVCGQAREPDTSSATRAAASICWWSGTSGASTPLSWATPPSLPATPTVPYRSDCLFVTKFSCLFQPAQMHCIIQQPLASPSASAIGSIACSKAH